MRFFGCRTKGNSDRNGVIPFVLARDTCTGQPQRNPKISVSCVRNLGARTLEGDSRRNTMFFLLHRTDEVRNSNGITIYGHDGAMCMYHLSRPTRHRNSVICPDSARHDIRRD